MQKQTQARVYGCLLYIFAVILVIRKNVLARDPVNSSVGLSRLNEIVNRGNKLVSRWNDLVNRGRELVSCWNNM